MSFEATWISHTGDVWELTSVGFVAGIMAEGITGLVGEVEDRDETLAGEPGEILLGQRVRSVEGKLRVLLRDDVDMESTYSRFRQSFSHRHDGSLILRNPMKGIHVASLRRSGAIAEPEVDPGREDVAIVEVPLKNRSGLWWRDWQSGTGSVTVSNFGDTPLWVDVEWNGSGAALTLPSTARITLPTVSGKHRLLLNRRDSCAVIGPDGVEVPELSKQVRVQAGPEGVPVEQERVFTTSGDARVMWRIGVLDPW